MLIVLPGREGVLTQPFPGFFPLNVLLDGLAKEPVRRSAASFSQTLNTRFRFGVEFEGGGRGAGHGWDRVLPLATLAYCEGYCAGSRCAVKCRRNGAS